MSTTDLVQNIAKDTRWFPCLISMLAFALFALFFKEMTDYLKNYFVPALVIYSLGAGLIAWFQTMLAIRN